MTDSDKGQPRYRLDLEINDEEDPGYIARILEGLAVEDRGEQPHQVGGNFPTHRFVSGYASALLELAHRWVGVGTEAENLDAWEAVVIVDTATERELELISAVDQGLGIEMAGYMGFSEDDGHRFNAGHLQIRLSLPISTSDEDGGQIAQAVLAQLRMTLEGEISGIESVYRAEGLHVTVE